MGFEDRFNLRVPLGEGAVGALWNAEDREAERSVAVAVLEDDAPEAVASRFRQVTQALAGVEHPNVVRVFDVGDNEEGAPYASMELLTGRTLADRLNDGVPPTVREVVGWVVSVLDGLKATHDAGIVHGDLEPGNVMLAEVDGGVVPKLIAFGLNRVHLRSGAEEPESSDDEGAIRSMAYASPQQVSGGELSAGDDLYGVGAILYDALTGQLPHASRDVATLREEIQKGGVPLTHKVRPDVAGALAGVVDRAINMDPGRRHPDAKAMQRGLKSALIMSPKVAELEARGGRRTLDPMALSGFVPEKKKTARTEMKTVDAKPGVRTAAAAPPPTDAGGEEADDDGEEAAAKGEEASGKAEEAGDEDEAAEAKGEEADEKAAAGAPTEEPAKPGGKRRAATSATLPGVGPGKKAPVVGVVPPPAMQIGLAPRKPLGKIELAKPKKAGGGGAEQPEDAASAFGDLSTEELSLSDVMVPSKPPPTPPAKAPFGDESTQELSLDDVLSSEPPAAPPKADADEADEEAAVAAPPPPDPEDPFAPPPAQEATPGGLGVVPAEAAPMRRMPMKVGLALVGVAAVLGLIVALSGGDDEETPDVELAGAPGEAEAGERGEEPVAEAEPEAAEEEVDEEPAEEAEPVLVAFALGALPEGASLTLDGEPVAPERLEGTTLSIERDFQPHLLAVEAEGFEPWSRSVVADGDREVEVELVEVEAEEPEEEQLAQAEEPVAQTTMRTAATTAMRRTTMRRTTMRRTTMRRTGMRPSVVADPGF